MNKVVAMRSGEYRLLIRKVDLATAVVAVMMRDWRVAGTQEKRDSLDQSEADLREAQQKLEDHVNEHGLPKVGERF